MPFPQQFFFCWFDTARRNLALDVLVFRCSLKVRNPFFMGWHDAEAWWLRSNRRSAILAAGLFDRFLDSIKDIEAKTFCITHYVYVKNMDMGNGKDRVRRAYTLVSSSGKSSSSWVAGGLRKVHIELFLLRIPCQVISWCFLRRSWEQIFQGYYQSARICLTSRGVEIEEMESQVLICS